MGEAFEKGFFMRNYIKFLARTGIIAALYTVLTLLVLPLASGAIQIRVSEGLCLLPLMFIEAIPGLAVGCLIANLITGCAFFDILFGSLITLVSAIFTFFVGKTIKNTPLKIIIGGLFPVVLNAVFLPLIWEVCYGAGEYVYLAQTLLLLVGQTVSVYGVGTPVYLKLKNIKNK